MKSRLAARFLKLSATLALLPAVASAHPGHEGGHDLSWDLSGGIEHALLPLGSLIAIGLVVLVVKFRQSRKTR
jgi:urease accessory protein